MSSKTSDTADGILIEPDEDGFHLIVSGEKAEYNFRLPHDIAIELLQAASREIGSWVFEGRISLPRRFPEDPGRDGEVPTMRDGRAVWEKP